MASELSQDAVLLFLRESGGSAKNADLLLHFRSFIRDNADRNRNRELFKTFVNTVATVRSTDGVSYVVLRKKFKDHRPEVQSTGTGRAPGGGRRWNKFQHEEEGGGRTVLPAAGIVVSTGEGAGRSPGSQPHTPGRHSESLTPALKPSIVHPGAPPPQRTGAGQQGVPPGLPELGSVTDQRQQVQAKPGNHQPPKPSEQLHITARRVRHRQSYKTAVSCDDEEEEEEDEGPPVKLQQSSKPSWSPDAPLRESGLPDLASAPCFTNSPVSSSSSSSSSPRIVPQIYVHDTHLDLRRPLQPEEAEFGTSPLPFPPPADSSGRCRPSETTRCSGAAPPRQQCPPTTGDRYPPTHQSQPALQSQLPSSHSSILSSSAGTGFPSSEWSPDGSARPAGWDRSPTRPQSHHTQPGERQGLQEQTLHLQGVPHEGVARHPSPVHSSAGQRFEGQASQVSPSPPRRSAERLGDQISGTREMPWYLSTGDLYEGKDADSSEDSDSQHHLGVPKHLRRKMRNRMCRSLGADLDQLIQDEDIGGRVGEGRAGGGEAARLNRLHRISSSLSLHYALSNSSLSSCSTPPRCRSLGNLVDPVGGCEGGPSLPDVTSTQANADGHSRQSVFPLEPREHTWLVKGAAGAWTDIYSLFREDSSLLNRQDFISGFTVLHWIAKHGDHRVLNTLWYGVEKAGLTFNVNARSRNGHTPLHIAAIHGNKNILRLLVTKFRANVLLRDTAGKKPWQYLSSDAPLEMFKLLEAPARAVKAGEGLGDADSSWKQQQHRRHLRHHFSSASSGERPLKYLGGTKVKRSSSLAAFLKHKSLHRFYGRQSDHV